ncbi:hypothetical protein CASFOL_001690 [Castilleja foliolosa]|uniref:Uncharacterized protein n=1 Tax=Castilleja foliolosa TaxID=1961234 RepID=A0ABD3EG62_9LAMI
MAGNTRFELTSASPEASFSGNYPNVQRGYSTPTLDRSTSFRESADSRNFASVKANSRGSVTTSGDSPALSQCLILEPIVYGDQKHAWSGDLRRVIGSSIGNSSEDNSFGTAPVKNSSPVAVEELKRYRASVADSCVKASGRAKKLDDHLSKLNKYFEATFSKKQQQRNEMLTNERSNGQTLKIGSPIHRNITEFGSQKFDDRPKNVGFNKRVRTSVAETRTECRNSGAPRQPMTVTRERDLHKDSNADSDIVEGKIKTLPAGEGWDKKMKRKRSVGAVFPRSIDNDGEPKRTMQHKHPGESSLQYSDSTHSFRSVASGSSNKLDPASSPVGSSARTTLKNEQEKSMLSRDLSSGSMKERPLGKVNVRMGNREENNAMCPSPILKGKASRAPRSGSIVAVSSPPNIPRVPGTLESWEQAQPINKNPTVSGANNRRRSIPTGSSSPPITQWVGQRPQKISRTRRTNLIPVSSHDDVQTQSEGCMPSDFSPRLSSGTNAAVPAKSSASGNLNFKAKSENVPSPARLSESEESGAVEIRMKEKDLGSGDGEEKDANASQNVGPTAIPIKKNKIMVKEESGDGVRRQGRSGRMSPFSRASTSPTREKSDSMGPTKPQRNPNSEKNGSKSGRPVKKLSDRKGFSHLGHIANRGSPDCSGESEDDREELIAAANLACYSSLNACTSPFWKTVESLFASIGPDERSSLSEQLKLVEESCTSPFQNNGHDNNTLVKLDDYGHEDIAAPDSLSFVGYRRMKNDIGLKNSLDMMEFAEKLQTHVFGFSETENRYDIVTPLYQRVLSALIMEDEIEETEETGFGRPRSSISDSRLLGAKRKHMDNEHITFSCNGNGDFDSAQDRLCNGELLQRDGDYVHSDIEVLVRLSTSRCDYVLRSLQMDNCSVSSFDGQYEQMCVEEKLVLELQSIGLFIEAVPALDDKEDNVIDHEIVQLEKGLHEKTGKKKSCLGNIYESIQEGKNTGRRDPEAIAMDKLVELAYKKLLATRGSFASKHGIAKVSKQVALAFAKRTLARCRRFKDSSMSSFSEPSLRDVLFATPPQFDETELLTCASLSVANDDRSANASDASIQQSSKNGTVSNNRAKRKKLSLDDVGGAVFRASSALGISDGGAKGKRSERDRDRDASARNNNGSKAGRPSMGGSKGERKAKSKPPMQKAANGFVASASGGSGESANSSGGNRRKDVTFMSSGLGNVVPQAEMKEPVEFASLPMNEMDGIDELGVDSEIGEPQDLNAWFNFDVDGLQDIDAVGLEIPMDDLAELNMF